MSAQWQGMHRNRLAISVAILLLFVVLALNYLSYIFYYNIAIKEFAKIASHALSSIHIYMPNNYV